MKRLLLGFLLISLASTPVAGTTMGLYFDHWPGKMDYSPPPTSFFDVYMYLHDAPYFVTALEYSLLTPADPAHSLFIIVETELTASAVVELGSPWEGHSLAFWPPLSGFDPGYNMICKYTCMTLAPCGAGIMDYPIVVGPHPVSAELWGTYFPDNNTFPIVGLTSIICPVLIGVEETSWGAIKNLF
jgi:hypothetical protein